MKRIRLPAKFSVEAAVLLPFLMILTVTAISFIVYVCDRAMIIQDVNAACADIRCDSNETNLENHPYLLMNGLGFHVTKENARLTVEAHGKWFSPLWYGLNKVISKEQTVYVIRPTKVMRIAMDISEKKKKLEEKDDRVRDNP